MRTEAEIRAFAPIFIEAAIGRPAHGWMVDLLVAVSLRRNIPGTNPTNRPQTITRSTDRLKT